MAARGIVLTAETIRQCSQKFGQHSANQLRQRRAQTGDKWHLDEVFLTITGKQQYLWRAVAAWQSALYPGAEPPQQSRSQEMLAQAAESVSVRRARADHR
jgi:hypothetical protein